MAQAAPPSYLVSGKTRATPFGLWLWTGVGRALMLREEGNRRAGTVGAPVWQEPQAVWNIIPAPSLWHHPSLHEETEAQRADRQKLAKCDVTCKCCSWGQLRAPPRRFWPPGNTGWHQEEGGDSGSRMEVHLLCSVPYTCLLQPPGQYSRGQRCHAHLTDAGIKAYRVNVGSGAMRNLHLKLLHLNI